LVVPFDARLRLSESYFVAWDRTVLEKPLGAELRTWLFGLGKERDMMAKGQKFPGSVQRSPA
jgi:LysR family glycine cleavage system transcriptional activator